MTSARSIIVGDNYEGSTCDVLIIGSGTSGLTTALELAQRGVGRIVVVERGPFHGFEHETQTAPSPTLPLSFDGVWRTANPHYDPVPGTASPVGGRSRGWYGVAVPIDRELVVRRWPSFVATRLLGDGPGSFSRALTDLAEWRGEPLDTPQCGSDVAVREVLRQRWQDVQVDVVPQAGWSMFGRQHRRWRVYSPLLSWHHEGLPRFRQAPLPTIVHGLRAVRLTVGRSGSVTGAVLRGSGGTREIHAGAVVLAAGTLENTRLYAQAMSHVVETILEWRGLNDHLPHGFVAPLPECLHAAWTDPDRVFLWAPMEPSMRANLFVDIHAAALPEPVLDVWWMAQQEEPLRDHIQFEPGDDVWSARIVSSPHRLDSLAVERRDARAEPLAEALGLNCVEATEHVAEARLGLFAAIPRAFAARRAVRYLNTLGTSDHEAGTVPLGSHLAPGGEAPWANGLFVTGPATFPTPGAANPTVTILALAAQTAERIAG